MDGKYVQTFRLDFVDQAQDVTMLLHRVANGDASASDELLPIVYQDLRAVAGSYFRGQRADHTLQPTALVHEAYIRMVKAQNGAPTNKSHFMANAGASPLVGDG